MYFESIAVETRELMLWTYSVTVKMDMKIETFQKWQTLHYAYAIITQVLSVLTIMNTIPSASLCVFNETTDYRFVNILNYKNL